MVVVDSGDDGVREVQIGTRGEGEEEIVMNVNVRGRR